MWRDGINNEEMAIVMKSNIIMNKIIIINHSNKMKMAIMKIMEKVIM